MAVTCPFNINNISRSSPCEHYARYDEDFKGTQFFFSALESTGVLMKKGGTCCVKYFVLQPSEKEFSLVSTAVELGLASLATYNFQFLKQFSIA